MHFVLYGVPVLAILCDKMSHTGMIFIEDRLFTLPVRTRLHVEPKLFIAQPLDRGTLSRPLLVGVGNFPGADGGAVQDARGEHALAPHCIEQLS